VREARTDKFILGIDISQGAVSKYMIRHLQPPSQTWRSFLRNHLGHLASVDFFVVSTATFRLLFVFIVLHHERRRAVRAAICSLTTDGPPDRAHAKARLGSDGQPLVAMMESTDLPKGDDPALIE
jgi:hypothetical protein